MPPTETCREIRTALVQNGYYVVQEVISQAEVEQIVAALDQVDATEAVRRNGGQVFAVRNLLQLVPEVRQIAASRPLREYVEAVLGPEAHAVRATLFNKTPGANWHVGWHQDLTIAVKERLPIPGFERWSEKASVPHVQPPATVLAEMLVARIHLDPCDARNGALRVLPGSHRDGRLDSVAVESFLATGKAVTCEVPQGGALLMRPLLLHASSRAQTPHHRRVIHLEFAAQPLPGGLEWSL